MANKEHLDLLNQGVEVWNQWRLENSDINLREANLRETNLSQFNLSGAHLEEANLYKANLQGAMLQGAVLTSAHLEEAHLEGANLYGAYLRDANLSRAHLEEAILEWAHLEGSILYNAHLGRTHLEKAILSGVDLRGAHLEEACLEEVNLREANLNNTILSKASLKGAYLNKAMLVETDLQGANLTGCSIYGISVWNVQLQGATQSDLVITPSDEPTITVDDLEVAQFIYLLLSYKKLRNVLNAVTAKGVLILGRFGGGGLEVLQAIAAKLRVMSYLPMIFDFERPRDRDYTETVKTLIGLVRFVIVDLSGPSVPQELSHTVPFFDIPFVPIIEKGKQSYSMFIDLLKYPWVLKPPIEFATVEELLARMPSEVIAPAEEKHQARQKLLDELFNKA